MLEALQGGTRPLLTAPVQLEYAPSAQHSQAVQMQSSAWARPCMRQLSTAQAVQQPTAHRACAACRAASASLATTYSPDLPSGEAAASASEGKVYQTGMRWPHHSCLEMHQSRMPPSHLFQVATKRSGCSLSLPSATACTIMDLVLAAACTW